MAIYKYPRILKDDYNGFRLIVPDLPATFEKWNFDVQGKREHDRLAHEAVGGQFESYYVTINGGKFMEFCQRTSEPRTVTALYRFASESRD